jgi:two-component system, NtrC family, response regulator AtoC
MSHSILVIEDDPAIQRVIELAFDRPDWHITAVTDAAPALEMFTAGVYDVVLLDLNLPTVSGLVVLQVLRERDPNVAVIMLTAYGDVATAVEAMQLGAENFLNKPFDIGHLEAVIERALEKAELRRRTEYLLRRQSEAHPLAALGETPAMREVAARIEVLAPADATVLLLGETGTGKGWTAELIHSLSPRAAGPFVEINCAGLSATFLDSELFGHEKGAYTDAKTQKRGLFEVANGGTLFLDEVGDLASELQPKLLKALETRRFRRLGATREISVDVRLIAATNHDLRARVRAGRFREDLYYRIAAHLVTLPPLRARGEQAVMELAVHLLASVRRELGRGPKRISAEALRLIQQHAWPGNVRELRNVLEHAVLNARGSDVLLPAMLPAELAGRATAGTTAPAADRPRELAAFLAAAEREHIVAALREAGGNRSRAARALGISRATLYEKLSRHGLGTGTDADNSGATTAELSDRPDTVSGLSDTPSTSSLPP